MSLLVRVVNALSVDFERTAVLAERLLAGTAGRSLVTGSIPRSDLGKITVVPAPLQRPQQSSHVPFRDAELLSRLVPGDQLFACVISSCPFSTSPA